MYNVRKLNAEVLDIIIYEQNGQTTTTPTTNTPKIKQINRVHSNSGKTNLCVTSIISSIQNVLIRPLWEKNV